MALDTRIALAIKPPEIDDPAVAYSRALTNRRGEQILSEGALDLQAKQAKAQQDREQRMRDAQVSQILARSASPYDAIESIYQVDPNKAHDLASKNADQAMRMIQGVSSYQALQSVWPTVQKYVGPQDLPQFQSQDEFNQWKREQALAHVDAKTYLEQTKPAAQRTTANPTEASLALAAAGGDEPSTKALEIIKGQRAKEPTDTSDLSKSSLDVQAAAALAKGDMDTYNRLLKVKKEMGQADDRPRVTVNAGGIGANIPGDFSKTGDEFLATVPQQWRATVKKIANYDEDPTKVASMRGGLRETLMTWVNQVNPAYDQSQFAVRSPTRKAFITGPQGQQINSINTALGHIDQLSTVAADLENSGFVPGNKAWNAVRTAFGSDKVTNFDTLKDALAGEVDSVLSKSGATVSGIAAAKEKINGANSPTQLAGYAKTIIPILGSKLSELDYQYHQAMGADDSYSALSPASKSILIKYGFDPEHPEIGASGGRRPAATPATAAGRDRVVGPNGETGTVPAGTALPPGWRKQ